MRRLLVSFFLVFTVKATDLSLHSQPLSKGKNSNYVSNRSPLKASSLIKLPVGAIKPEGWLKENLRRQNEGLSGKLGEISPWLLKEGNAWLSKDGKGQWGWEELPYWLKGYANAGYIFEDQKIIDEAKIWIEGVLAGQRANGDFGPVHMWGRSGARDYWGNMIMLYCLQSYYEYSKDERVIELMTKYFKYQLTVPDNKFLVGYWQKVRGGDNLHSVMWLYNRTGDKFLLELMEKIHRNTSDWTKRDYKFRELLGWGKGHHKRHGIKQWPKWHFYQPNWHNVNLAQCFREPAQYYLLSKDEKYLKAAYENYEIPRRHYGQVPGGMFGGDENCRVGYDDPRQAIETCALVEQMNSDQHMLRITGDTFWADHCEEIAFNTYPAAITEDFKALRYLTAPNHVSSTRQNHSPGIDNKGSFFAMNPFSSRCCQHNHAQGWPYFVENMWMATPDNGVAAVLYSANTVKVKVGNGVPVEIKQDTKYPFEENINFKFKAEKAVEFPFYLRIPKWSQGATIKVNGQKLNVKAEAKNYVRINRTWKTGDVVDVHFPMELKVERYKNNHNAASVHYGPLLFSLKIKQKLKKIDSRKALAGDARFQKTANPDEWPTFEIYPDSAWNYGLVFNESDLKASFKVLKKSWPKSNYPFNLNAAPIRITAKAKLIPEWKLGKEKLVGELQDSPVKSDEKTVEVELLPAGAARLRITAFPVIGEGADAKKWK